MTVAEALDALNSERTTCGDCGQGLYYRQVVKALELLKAIALKHGKTVLTEDDLARARNGSLRVFFEGTDGLSISCEDPIA